MSDQTFAAPRWQIIPLINESHYKTWWQLNCRNCIKSAYKESGNDCDLEDALCRASVALHGMGKRKPSDDIKDVLGGGYATQEVSDRLGINESGLPWHCPEKIQSSKDGGRDRE